MKYLLIVALLALIYKFAYMAELHQFNLTEGDLNDKIGAAYLHPIYGPMPETELGLDISGNHVEVRNTNTFSPDGVLSIFSIIYAGQGPHKASTEIYSIYLSPIFGVLLRLNTYMDVYMMKYSGNPAVCTGLDHHFRRVAKAPLVTPYDNYYGILLSVGPSATGTIVRIIWKSTNMPTSQTLEFDTATICDVPLTLNPTPSIRFYTHYSFALLRETRIFSHFVTEAAFLNMLDTPVFDQLEYSKGQVSQLIDMTDPSFNSCFLAANTVDNIQGPDGILCRNTEYAVLTNTPLDLGITHSILFILKFDPIPLINVWTNILKLEQNDNEWTLLIKIRRNGDGTSTWQIEFNGETHSGNVPSPDYSTYFYFGYSMFPKSPSVLYIYFRIFPDNLLFEVNAGSLTFDEVNIYAGKYDGFLSTMYFHNLGGMYIFFERIYWRYCQTPQNVTRSICLQCGSGKLLYAYGLCENCYAECSECVYHASSCTVCASGHFPYDNGLGCNTTTPVHHRFFQDNLWKICNGECSECQNEKANCSICYEEDYKYTTGSTSTCLNQCDSHRQYAVVTVTPPVRKCEDCHIKCDGCVAPGTYKNCTQCNDDIGYHQIPWYNEETETETFFCGCDTDNHYFNYTANQCIPCDIACLGCEGQKQRDCYVCHPAAYKILDADSLAGYMCIMSMPNAYFESVNRLIHPCAEFCIDCTNLTDCHKCEINESMVVEEGICVCRVGWVYIVGECKKCHEYCFSCSELSYVNCTECASDAYIHLGYNSQECAKICPAELPRTFLDQDLSKCVDCSPECENCFGINSNECYSCPKPMFIFISTCYDTCPTSTFVDQLGITCIRCPQLCLTCTSTVNCSQCLSGALLYNLQCFDACPHRTYLDPINSSLCLDCDISCGSCNGPGIRECISCRYTYVFEESLCVSQCSMGYYFNTTLNRCDICHSSCLSCYTSLSSNCRSCQNDLGIYLIGGSCKTINCNTGEYFDQTLVKCNICHSNCLSCTGPKITNCNSCFTGKVYSDGQCLRCEEADPKLITMKTEGRIYCSEKCGDGYNLGIKECDDGNEADGDGCNRECIVEKGFLCSGGSLISSDKCRGTVRPTFMLSHLDRENSFVVILFDKPVYMDNVAVEFRDIIQLSVEGPINYTFEYTVNNYLITSPIPPILLEIIGNSNMVANYENPAYEFEPFFNQLKVNMEFKCSISGEEEELRVRISDSTIIQDIYLNPLVIAEPKIKLNKFIYIDEDAKAASEKTGNGVRFGSVVAILLSLGLQFAFGNALEYMINLLYFLQIICLIPLMNLNLPPHLSQFITGYLRFSNLQFDFIPNPFAQLFQILDNTPINSSFKDNGYKSKSLFINYGQQMALMIIYLLLWPVSIFINWVTKRKFAFIKRWKESYKFNGIIVFFSYSYICCSLVTFISIHQVDMKHTWEYYLSTSLSMVFMLMIGSFPLIITNILFNKKLLYNKPRFKAKFGILTEGYNFEHMKVGNKYWFHLFALVRKLSHAAIIAFLFNHIIMQLVGIQILTLIVVIWNYKMKPMKTLPLRIVLLVGDIGIFMIHIFLCLFVPKVKIEEEQASRIGFCVIGVILCVFVLNIVLMASSIIYKIYLTRLKTREERKNRIIRPLYIRRRLPKKSKIIRKRQQVDSDFD